MVKTVPGVSSALAERLTGGRYIDVDVDRLARSAIQPGRGRRQAIISSAIGGDNVGEVIKRARALPHQLALPA